MVDRKENSKEKGPQQASRSDEREEVGQLILGLLLVLPRRRPTYVLAEV